MATLTLGKKERASRGGSGRPCAPTGEQVRKLPSEGSGQRQGNVGILHLFRESGLSGTNAIEGTLDDGPHHPVDR